MPVQVHSCSGQWDGVFDSSYIPNEGFALKPIHAFWTSSLLSDGTTGWSRFSENEPDPEFDRLYEVDAGSSLLVLSEPGDLFHALDKAGLISGSMPGQGVTEMRGIVKLAILCMEYERMTSLWKWAAENYDGVHVPMLRRWPGSPLSSWDCESTAWFRPWERLKLIEPGHLFTP